VQKCLFVEAFPVGFAKLIEIDSYTDAQEAYHLSPFTSSLCDPSSHTCSSSLL
jgi:hypothetical protein